MTAVVRGVPVKLGINENRGSFILDGSYPCFYCYAAVNFQALLKD